MTVYLTKSMLAKMNRLRYPATSPYEDETSSNSNEHWQKLMLDNKISDRLAKDMLCRVCAKNGCTPINDKINGCSIMSAIASITNINISPEDSLPKFICTDCLEALKVALSFKKSCEASDRKFKKIINPGGDPLFHSYPYSKHDFQLILHQMKLNRMKYEEIKEKERQEKIRLMNKKLKVSKISKGPRMKLFKCSPCDVTFPTKEKLVAHRRERQCTRRACDVCGQLVLNITQHMRHIHKETVPHKCPTCGKEFPVIARLKNHMLVHTDTFSFFCDLCPYKSKHKYYLVMHMRTHTGEKPYKCAHCPATFVNPSNLNKHKLTHQEKQFKCMLCEKAFRTSTALREHHEAAHMNIKHTCNYCGRDFCYKSDLRKHEIRNHNRLKRDYVGGEPTYKQVERLKMQQSNEADKWHEAPQVSIAAPLTTHVTSYATHVAPHVTHATHVPSHVTHATPLVQTTYLDQNKEFIQTTTHEVYLSDVIGLLQQRQPQMVQPQAVQIPMSDVPCAGSNCIFLE